MISARPAKEPMAAPAITPFDKFVVLVVLGEAWSERRNGKILNDKVVKNQWCRTVHEVVDSVFDRQLM